MHVLLELSSALSDRDVTNRMHAAERGRLTCERSRLTKCTWDGRVDMKDLVG